MNDQNDPLREAGVQNALHDQTRTLHSRDTSDKTPRTTLH